MLSSTITPAAMPSADDKGVLKSIEMRDLMQPANNRDTIEELPENASEYNQSLREPQDPWTTEHDSTGSRSKLRLATVMLALYVSLGPSIASLESRDMLRY